jgi:hypothetical protein
VAGVLKGDDGCSDSFGMSQPASDSPASCSANGHDAKPSEDGSTEPRHSHASRQRFYSAAFDRFDIPHGQEYGGIEYGGLPVCLIDVAPPHCPSSAQMLS